MRLSPITSNHVRDLNIAAVTAWKQSGIHDLDLRGYDLLIEELIVAERLLELPTNPAYWSMEDVHTMKVYIMRIQAAAEAFHLSLQKRQSSTPTDD